MRKRPAKFDAHGVAAAKVADERALPVRIAVDGLEWASAGALKATRALFVVKKYDPQFGVLRNRAELAGGHAQRVIALAADIGAVNAVFWIGVDTNARFARVYFPFSAV
jgi:hypothetical protein